MFAALEYASIWFYIRQWFIKRLSKSDNQIFGHIQEHSTSLFRLQIVYSLKDLAFPI